MGESGFASGSSWAEPLNFTRESRRPCTEFKSSIASPIPSRSPGTRDSDRQGHTGLPGARSSSPGTAATRSQGQTSLAVRAAMHARPGPVAAAAGIRVGMPGSRLGAPLLPARPAAPKPASCPSLTRQRPRRRQSCRRPTGASSSAAAAAAASRSRLRSLRLVPPGLALARA